LRPWSPRFIGRARIPRTLGEVRSRSRSWVLELTMREPPLMDAIATKRRQRWRVAGRRKVSDIRSKPPVTLPLRVHAQGQHSGRPFSVYCSRNDMVFVDFSVQRVADGWPSALRGAAEYFQCIQFEASRNSVRTSGRTAMRRMEIQGRGCGIPTCPARSAGASGQHVLWRISEARFDSRMTRPCGHSAEAVSRASQLKDIAGPGIIPSSFCESIFGNLDRLPASEFPSRKQT